MNHPKREEWIPYLYGEAKPDVQRELKAHLKSCPQCQAELAGWEQSLSRLDAWELPRAQRRESLALPILKWAVAPALVLALGFIAGHLSSTKPDIESIRAAIEPQMRRELKQELTQLVRDEVNKAAAETLAQTQQQSAKAIAACAAAIEAKHARDQQDVHAALLVLKEQLDTVAMNTDAGFRQAEQKLVQLADYKQPRNASTQP
jgi:anti-sigma factor RsiW